MEAIPNARPGSAPAMPIVTAPTATGSTVGPAGTGRLTPGLAGEPYEMPVERGKVREFARATKACDKRFVVDPATFLPPTFLVTNAFWLAPGSWVLEYGDLDWARLLSGGSELTFSGPPLRARERLTATQRVDEVYRKHGRRGGDMTFIVFTTTFVRPDGSVAALERHTTIVSSRPPASSAPASPGQVSRAPAAPRRPGDAPASGAPESGSAVGLAVPAPSRPTAIPGGAHSLRPGDWLPPLVDEPVTVTDIVRYQGASGDMNPIHHDPEAARAAGFPTVFSVGMLHAGIFGSYLGDLFGAEHVRKFGVQFREQAWPGDVLTYSAQVTARRPRPDGSLAELDLTLTARRHPGGEHLRGHATVLTKTAATSPVAAAEATSE